MLAQLYFDHQEILIVFRFLILYIACHEFDMRFDYMCFASYV